MASKQKPYEAHNPANGAAFQGALDIDTAQIGRIRRVDIDTEMKQAYLSYSMSVIVSRALPDARDGLKPVQRRILYVMHDNGLRADTPYRKSARIVGDVLGKYHPHGDASVYEAMARMAQDFSMRYLLVDGQGNFGSIDGDPPAAMRYTEARLSHPAMDLLADLDKETVDFVENYDGTQQEPTVLPAALPNLLLNGATGIAVGMATNIPPHNMGEICDATCFMIDKYIALPNLSAVVVTGKDNIRTFEALPEIEVDVDDLMKYVKGPDFPTGGIVFRYGDTPEQEDIIRACYGTGRGKLIVQAKTHIEDGQRGKTHIIVSELPYAVNKAALIERIADLARDGKIAGITDIHDESDRRGMRIVIDIGKGEDARKILGALYKYTAMRSTFGVIMLALVDGEPRVLSLRKMLQVFIEHRREVVRRRSEFDLTRARERAHILEGLVKALDVIDEIIKLIRASKDVDTARKGLISQFAFSDLQAQAILEMPLRRLAALERKKLEEELAEKRKIIAHLESLLTNPAKMLGAIKAELVSLKQRFGDARRTAIVGKIPESRIKSQESRTKNQDGSEPDNAAEANPKSKIQNSKSKIDQMALTTHDLIPEEDCYVIVGSNGKIGRVNEQPRVTAAAKEVPAAIVKTSAKALIYVIGSSGRAVVLGVNNLPIEDVTAGEGAPLSALSPFLKDDEVAGAFAIERDQVKREGGGFLITCTASSMVKRSELSALPTVPGQMFVACGVSDNDTVISARMTKGDEEVMLFSQLGMAIRFKQEEVRPMGLPAGGVVGMKLENGDLVMALTLVQQTYVVEHDVILATTDGKAKRLVIDDYPIQGRAGKGVVTTKLLKDATVADAVIAAADDTIVYVTVKGNAKSLKARNLQRRGRSAFGDDAMSMAGGTDRLAKLVVV